MEPVKQESTYFTLFIELSGAVISKYLDPEHTPEELKEHDWKLEWMHFLLFLPPGIARSLYIYYIWTSNRTLKGWEKTDQLETLEPEKQQGSEFSGLSFALYILD